MKRLSATVCVSNNGYYKSVQVSPSCWDEYYLSTTGEWIHQCQVKGKFKDWPPQMDGEPTTNAETNP